MTDSSPIATAAKARTEITRLGILYDAAVATSNYRAASALMDAMERWDAIEEAALQEIADAAEAMEWGKCWEECFAGG